MNPTERQAAIDKAVAEAKTKHKFVYLYEVADDDNGRFVLFHQASPSDLQKFRENANDAQLQYTKETVLTYAVLVYPSPAEFSALVQDFPAVPYSIANEVWRFGRGGDSVAKKV
jgi:hypothetical protein